MKFPKEKFGYLKTIPHKISGCTKNFHMYYANPYSMIMKYFVLFLYNI